MKKVGKFHHMPGTDFAAREIYSDDSTTHFEIEAYPSLVCSPLFEDWLPPRS